MRKRRRMSLEHTIKAYLPLQLVFTTETAGGSNAGFMFNVSTPSLNLPDWLTVHLIYLLVGLHPSIWLEEIERFTIWFYLFIDTLFMILGDFNNGTRFQKDFTTTKR